MQSVVDDSWQLRVLDERDLVNVLLLVASHQQILVKIPQVWHQLVVDELRVQVGVIVFQV